MTTAYQAILSGSLPVTVRRSPVRGWIVADHQGQERGLVLARTARGLEPAREPYDAGCTVAGADRIGTEWQRPDAGRSLSQVRQVALPADEGHVFRHLCRMVDTYVSATAVDGSTSIGDAWEQAVVMPAAAKSLRGKVDLDDLEQALSACGYRKLTSGRWGRRG